MTGAAPRPSTAPQPGTGAEAAGTGALRWRPSIAATLTFGFGSLVVAAVVAVMWVSLGAARENTLLLLRRTAELTLESVIGRIDLHLGPARHEVEFLADLIGRGELEPADGEQMQEVLLGSLAAAPQVSGIAFIAADFSTIRVGRRYGELLKLDSDWSDRANIREWLPTMRDQRASIWSPVLWIPDLKLPSVTVNHSVRREGEFLGVMASVVSIGALSEFLDANDQAFGTRSFILYGRDRVLAHPSLAGGTRGLSEDKPLPSLGEVNDRVLAAIWRESVDDMDAFLADSPVRGRVVEGPDDDYIYLYRRIESFGPVPWYVGVSFLAGEVNNPYRRLFMAGAIALAILLVAITLALVLGQAIARPIRRLATASLAIRNLEMASIGPLKGSPFRELDSMVRAYNSMLSGLRWFETYVPKTLVFRLMRLGDATTRSEERTISVLFTDIAGFSSLSDRLSPAELAAFLNTHFALVAVPIDAENGTVDKYIGDSVMAFWGAPTTQPDHANQTCRAALAIAAAIAADNRKRRAAGGEPVRLRIGIHSGPAVVGNIGAPGRVNYTLIGDTVNVAQRLEELGKRFAEAEEDTVILLSGETAALLDSGFRLSSLGMRQLRGRISKTEVFRLTGHYGPPSSTGPDPQTS
jgi:class 3 adenylate cyclase